MAEGVPLIQCPKGGQVGTDSDPQVQFAAC